jgi:hypothetical protein
MVKYLFMRKLLIGLFILATILILPEFYNAHPHIPQIQELTGIYKKFPDLIDWKRPEGPVKIAIQVGHWKNDDFPEELAHLRDNDGASSQGHTEVEVNLKIAQETAKILKKQGYQVEILPATVPKAYWADVFIAIHADGNTNRKINGFKVSGPWNDYTGRASTLSEDIKTEYLKATRMTDDTVNISPNMGEYYAFSWNRFDHSIHPMTVASIVETGYLTNAQDRRVIVNNPVLSANAIAKGVIKFVNQQSLTNIPVTQAEN